MEELTGLHHVTAVTADPRANHAFYTRVLGMRLVKRTVNQDDVRAYHLFYADAVGTPGTDLTFFDWKLPRERRGTRSVVRTFLRVRGPAAVAWWADRLREAGVPARPVEERDGRATLLFEDPEGQRLALVDDDGRGDPPRPWERSPVPAEYQIRGLGPVVLSVRELAPTDRMLTAVLGMRRAREYRDPELGAHPVVVYEMGTGGPHAELHVAVQPELPTAALGAGGVHHVAFRTPTDETHAAWAEHLDALGVRHTGRIDRYYFQSLYFREPGGVLFEIATDGPGFSVDEDAATLGERLALPPFLEPYRAAITAGLAPFD